MNSLDCDPHEQGLSFVVRLGSRNEAASLKIELPRSTDIELAASFCSWQRLFGSFETRLAASFLHGYSTSSLKMKLIRSLKMMVSTRLALVDFGHIFLLPSADKLLRQSNYPSSFAQATLSPSTQHENSTALLPNFARRTQNSERIDVAPSVQHLKATMARVVFSSSSCKKLRKSYLCKSKGKPISHKCKTKCRLGMVCQDLASSRLMQYFFPA